MDARSGLSAWLRVRGRRSQVGGWRSWSFHRLQNPARRGGEVVDDRVGGDARRRPAFLDGTGSGPDENRARTGGAPELHVNPFVADHKRPREVEVQIRHGAIDQAASRFAALT